MKPVTLVNLAFFDENEINVVSESEQKTFHSFEDMQTYINNMQVFWSELFKRE